MAKKIALGKGIASLIKETPNEILSKSLREEDGKKVEKEDRGDGVAMMAISEIIKNPNQPRKIFKEKELKELSLSIKENGVIQPIVVAPSASGKGFELIAGERRLRASEMAGLEQVPVIIKKAATDKDKVVMAIIENVQRSDLNCVEEALAYFQLLHDYSLTQEEMAKKLGKERSTIANFLRILKLPRPVLDILQREELSFGHAKLLVGISEKEKIVRLADEAAREKYSVRELEKKIRVQRPVKEEKKTQSFYLEEKMKAFRDRLEKTTGHHIKISTKNNGAGEISLKFSNEAEFNDLFEFLMSRS